LGNVLWESNGKVETPSPGSVVEVAEGILWTRFPLPFALSHVNVYLLEDEGGWAAVDTGIGDEATKAIWTALLSGPLAGRRLTRLIVTHHHPDHMGLAGWLADRFEAPIHMTEAEFLLAQHLHQNARFVDEKSFRDLYLRHGMGASSANVLISQGHQYKYIVTEMPWLYNPLAAGDRLSVGGRRFEILTGGGHSSEQAMLFDRAGALFLGADQVLPKISPNVSVMAIAPEGNPLGRYLRSLAEIRAAVPADALVLSGHHVPFSGLHKRIDELALHHEERCRIIETACKSEAKTAAEIVPLLFRRDLDPHQMSFAFSETLAHMNMMAANERIQWKPDPPMMRALAR
jgi:glyoxylase-like metal-dependent hydrolase (beta-lactamase superfamily II)